MERFFWFCSKQKIGREQNHSVTQNSGTEVNRFKFSTLNITGNDHLIKFQLIEIVFYHLIEIVVISWSNFTWSNQLIESLNNDFGQTPKNWSVDRIIWSSAKIRPFLFGSWSKVLIMVFSAFRKDLINCQNPSVLFWNLI
jgi:hypothetical protein